jgi:predicted DNA-binding protein
MAREGNTIQINISIPKPLNAKLRELAEKENRSLSNYIANLLMQVIEEPE